MNTLKKQTILILTDHPTDAQGLTDLLQRKGSVQTVPLAQNAAYLKKETLPDLILIDARHPEICTPLKAAPKTQHIPLLFFSATNDEQNEIECLERGAIDYIHTSTQPSILKARLQNHLALARQHQEWQRLATEDPLTHLANRNSLNDSFEREVARSERYARPFSIILLDIDQFKTVNDTHGHLIGDRILAEMGPLLKTHLRNIDLPGRWGGDEFLILCPETNLDSAAQLARRLLNIYANQPFSGIGSLTASFGVATHRKGRTAQDIFLLADQALYRAKKEGRGRVERENPA